jgi:hypothetical protein
MPSIAIIFVGGTNRQHRYFWPSYNNCEAGIEHDLILVHRDGRHIPREFHNKYICENKIFPQGELVHKAFGAYRYYFQKYCDQYDYFAFISDDVVIKRDNWLLHAIQPMIKNYRMGWTASQIFNGNRNQYPHPSHLRAPIWFAKSQALKQVNWIFNDDHDGEMRIADQFVEAGYFGVQIGNLFNLAYDSGDPDHVSTILESHLYRSVPDKYTLEQCRNIQKKMLEDLDINNFEPYNIQSPWGHIGRKNGILDLEPFDGLIYDKSLSIATNNADIRNIGKDIFIVQ